MTHRVCTRGNQQQAQLNLHESLCVRVWVGPTGSTLVLVWSRPVLSGLHKLSSLVHLVAGREGFEFIQQPMCFARMSSTWVSGTKTC